MTNSKETGPRITNHGQVKEMTFPEQWVADEPLPNPGLGTRSFRKVHPRNAKAALVCFFYRGLPVAASAAASFRAVLNKQPHSLSLAELTSIREILGTKTPVNSRDFSLMMARTEDFNGKRVLIVEGRYPDGPEDIYEFYIDSDGSGQFVQEIYFQAPSELYIRYLSEAKTAFKSITWA